MEAGGRQRGNDDDNEEEVKRAELLEAFRSLDPEGDRGGWKTASGRSSTRHSRHSNRQSSRQSRGAAAGLAPRGWVPAPPDSRGRDKCGKLEYHSQDSSDESELNFSGADQQQQQQPRGRGREGGAVPTHGNAHAHLHARPQQPREPPAPRKGNNHSPGKRRVKFVEAQASAGEDGGQEELSKKRSKEEQSLPDLPFGRLHITRKGETWDLRNKLRHEDWRTIFLQLAIAIMNNPKLKMIDVRDNGLDCRAGAIIAAALKSNGNVERASDIPIGDLTAGKVEQLDLQHMGLSEAAILSVFLNGPANGVLKHLDFSQCVTEMGSQGGTALAKGLQGLNAISSLDLSHAGLSSDGMEVVSGGLESCRTLTKLHLGTNGLDYRSGAYLCRILSKNPMLTDLNLGNNNLGEKGVVDLLPGLRELRDITVIDLRNNKMGPEGAIQLASVLKFAPSLQVLNLGFNQIGVEGAQAIADTLSTFIRSLRLLRVNADLHVDKLRTESELQLVNKGFREEESVLLGAIFKNNRSLKVLNLRLNHLGEEECKSIAKGLAMMMKIETVNKQDVVRDSTLEDRVAEILVAGVREASNPPDTTMVWDGKVQKRAAIETKTLLRSTSFMEAAIRSMKANRCVTPAPELPEMEVYDTNWRPVTAVTTDDESGPGEDHSGDDEVDVHFMSDDDEGDGRDSPILSGRQSMRSSRRNSTMDSRRNSMQDAADSLQRSRRNSFVASTSRRSSLLGQDSGPSKGPRRNSLLSRRNSLASMASNGSGDSANAGNRSPVSLLSLHAQLSQLHLKVTEEPDEPEEESLPTARRGAASLAAKIKVKGSSFGFKKKSGITGTLEMMKKMKQEMPMSEREMLEAHIFDKNIDFAGRNLGPRGVAQLAASVAKSSVDVGFLDLSLNDMVGAGVEFGKIDQHGVQGVAGLLEAKKMVSRVNLSWNSLNEESGVILAPSLSLCVNMTCLDLYSNSIGPGGMAALAGALCNMTKLSELNIRYNEIGSQGGTALAKALPCLPSLTALDFAHNDVGLDGLEALLPHLRGLSLLTKLDVRGNEIGERGGRHLVELLAGKPFPALQRLNEVCIDKFITKAGENEEEEVSVYNQGPMDNYEMIFFANVVHQSYDTVNLERVAGYTVRMLKKLDVSRCNLEAIPPSLQALNYLFEIDVSHNQLRFIPFHTLMKMPNLEAFHCEGNLLLTLPPTQVANLGGYEVLDYLREVIKSGERDFEADLVVIGSVNSGKTSVIEAILSRDRKATFINKKDETVVAETYQRWTPKTSWKLVPELLRIEQETVRQMATGEGALVPEETPGEDSSWLFMQSPHLTHHPLFKSPGALPPPDGKASAVSPLHKSLEFPHIPNTRSPFEHKGSSPAGKAPGSSAKASSPLREGVGVGAGGVSTTRSPLPPSTGIGKADHMSPLLRARRPVPKRHLLHKAKPVGVAEESDESEGADNAQEAAAPVQDDARFRFRYNIIDVPHGGGGVATVRAMSTPRCVFIFTWRLKKYPGRKAMEAGIRAQGKTLSAWMTDLQLHKPGAGVLLAATHSDHVTDDEANEQCAGMQRAAQAVVRLLMAWAGKAVMVVAREGLSVPVNCLSGEGIRDLRQEAMLMTSAIGWYHEEVPALFMKVRDEIVGERERRYWMGWHEYMKLALDTGVSKSKLTMVTRFLHGRGLIWYFGTPSKAMQMPEDDIEGDLIMNTVFISPMWLHTVIECLYKRSHSELITWFCGPHPGGGAATADKGRLKEVYILMSSGVLHRDLVPYIWPRSQSSEDFFSKATNGRPGGEAWRSRVAETPRDYERIFLILEKLRVMRQNSVGHFVVPHLVSGIRSQTCDVRSIDDKNCKYGTTMSFPWLPRSLIERIVMEGMERCHYVDFGLWDATKVAGGLALYVGGDKTRLLFGPEKASAAAASSVMTFKASSPSAMKTAVECVKRAIGAFPTLQECAVFGEETGFAERGVKSPYHVVMSHSFQSISYCEALQRELQSRDANMRVHLEQVAELQKLLGLLSGSTRDLLHLHGVSSMDQVREIAFGKTHAWQKAGTRKLQREHMIRAGMLESDIQTIDRVLNSPKKEAICILVCIDDLYQHPSECDLNDIAYYVSIGTPIVQVIMPSDTHNGGSFKIHERLAATHEACSIVDMRGKHVWDDVGNSVHINRKRSGIERTLIPAVQRILDQWRGEVATGVRAPGALVPCSVCVSEGRHDGDYFELNQAKEIIKSNLRDRLMHLNSAPQVPRHLFCCWGHEEDPLVTISGPIPIKAVGCPSCMGQNIYPPHAFDFWHCLALASWVDRSLDQCNGHHVGPQAVMNKRDKANLAASMLVHTMAYRSKMTAPPRLLRRDSQFLSEVHATSNLAPPPKKGSSSNLLKMGGSSTSLVSASASASSSPRNSRRSSVFGSRDPRGDTLDVTSPTGKHVLEMHASSSGSMSALKTQASFSAKKKEGSSIPPSPREKKDSPAQGTAKVHSPSPRDKKARSAAAPHPKSGKGASAIASPRKQALPRTVSKKRSTSSHTTAVRPPAKGGYPITWRTKAEKRAGIKITAGLVSPLATAVSSPHAAHKPAENKVAAGIVKQMTGGAFGLVRGKVLLGEVQGSSNTHETTVKCPRCVKSVDLVSILKPQVYASYCIPEPVCDNCGVFTIRKLMPQRVNDEKGKHKGAWKCLRCDQSFEWVNPNKHQEASIATLTDRIGKELGVICMRHTLFIGRHGLTKAVQAASYSAIKDTSVFVCILNDDYLRSAPSCREFLCAMQSRRPMLPIITDPWNVPNVNGRWYPADSVVKMEDGMPVVIPWSVLRSFPHFDMRNVPRDVKDGQHVPVHDKVVQYLSSRVKRWDTANGETEAARIYNEIAKVRGAMLSVLGNIGMMSPAEINQECLNIFIKLDADESGTLDKSEILNGMHNMGVTLSDDLLEKFFKEVDEDNNGCLDFDEFKKLVFTVIASTATSASKFADNRHI